MSMRLMLLVLLLMGLGLMSAGVTADDAGLQETVIRESDEGVLLRVELGGGEVTADGLVQASGLEKFDRDFGAPDLPAYTTLIALPPEASVEEVVVRPLEVVRERGWVRPVGSPIVPDDFDVMGDTSFLEEGLIFEEDAGIYGRDALFPSEFYEVSEPMVARDSRFVRLTVHPVRFNPVAGVVETVVAWEVEVVFRPVPVRQAQGSESVVRVPAGTPAVRMEVNEVGIYGVGYEDLVAAGFPVDGLIPDSLRMMEGGREVAFEFMGNGDEVFDQDETVRFFGFPHDGKPIDESYFENNVFWLWSEEGGGARITSVENVRSGDVRESYRTRLKQAPLNYWHQTNTGGWDQFDNEPDVWFWDYLARSGGGEVSTELVVDVPGLDASDPDVMGVVSAEVQTYPDVLRTVTVNVNDRADKQFVWFADLSLDLDVPIQMGDFVDEANTVTVTLEGEESDRLGINHIEVEYQRKMELDNGTLYLDTLESGAIDHKISNLWRTSAYSFITWDVGDPHQPIHIDVLRSDFEGEDPGPYTMTFGAEYTDGGQFMITAVDEVMTPLAMTVYEGGSTQPEQGVEWLAIAPSYFMAEAERLAQHRQSASLVSTAVIDVDDIIQQYGFGKPLPEAIMAYLKEAMATWETQPRYVTLVGDSTINAAQRPCDHELCRANWSMEEVAHVPTGAAFDDRFIGYTPTDFPYTLVVGDDLAPDLAVGRLAVQSEGELTAMIDKIIAHETNITPAPAWMDEVLFVSDNTDSGGDFCLANDQASGFIPQNLTINQYCMEAGTSAEKERVRSLMIDHINSKNPVILSYRGHGSIVDWAGGLMSQTYFSDLDNQNRPFFTLSADCLDGNFAWPTSQRSLSQSMTTLETNGASGFWSSAGLGYSTEHSVLHEAFLDGVFNQGLTAIGDAVNHGKLAYLTAGLHQSELYAFILQGDPAMNLFRPDIQAVFLSEPEPEEAVRGETYSYKAVLRNRNHYPTESTLTISFPHGMTLSNLDVNAPASIEIDSEGGNQLIRVSSPKLTRGSQVIVEFDLTVESWVQADPLAVSISAHPHLGVDITQVNNTDTSILNYEPEELAITLTHQQTESASPPLLILILLLATLALIKTRGLNHLIINAR